MTSRSDTEDINKGGRYYRYPYIIINEVGLLRLTPYLLDKVALMYEEVIAKQMKERQATSTGGKNPQLKTKWSEADNEEKNTTRRKELAKIAGTSEGSIQRSKLILDKGTPEQIERARNLPQEMDFKAQTVKITLNSF